MKTLGLPISHKENENRRALIPADVATLRHPDMLWFETGYGDVIGFTDNDYIAAGAHVGTRDEVLSKDIICDPKIGDAEYLASLRGQTVFGWLHAVQNRDIAENLMRAGLTAYAWEDMYYRGRHVFYVNNLIAGQAAIMHAFQRHGVFPYGQRVAVIGRGNTALGAIKTLDYLGAHVSVYDRRSEHLLHDEISEYDVIVNAVLWDISRTDHIIYRDDLKRMKQGAMIIDISCDRAGAIETSVPTSIEHPDYMVDGIRHYVVDHTPSLFFKTASLAISKAALPYIDLLTEDIADSSEVMANACAVRDGMPCDSRITPLHDK